MDINTSDISRLFKEEKCCVLIPTFNNAATLRQVIENVMQFTKDIIVVNDGSTDDTEKILSSLTDIDVLSYVPNKGKGVALRRGFKYAHKKGYKYAITIDSDGQHDPEDLIRFIDKLKEEQNAIIIGARNMEQAGIPGKSSFGHKFSNFWFKFETGIDAPDTQSGYRLYPLEPLSKMKFYSRKYEFEIEVIVRAAWRGVTISFVPVKVYYPKERVSHFRPFQDFSRVSVLNTVLVTLALLYYIPLRLLRSIQKKSLKQLISENILDGNESNFQKSAAIGLGVFMGIVPIWGYQIVTAIAIAHLLRLNKILVVLSSHVSIPPMIPFIIFFSYKTGGLLLGGKDIDFSNEVNWEFVKQNLYQYLAGGVCFAIAAGLAALFISYILLTIFRKKKLRTV